ncbi:MAG TPA: aminopeptidase [Syntrophales bacterium]|nr:aminopeptidase [Syntrophales bacterium]
MRDPRVAKYAELIVAYSVEIKEGDKVLINGSTLAAPLLREVYAAVLRAGGFPLTMVSLPDMEDILYRHASDGQLLHVPPPLMTAIETYDAVISISGAENTKNLSEVDPQRVVTRNRGRREMLEVFMRRAAAGELRWVGALYPTNAYAQDAEMSLEDYEDFVFGACMPDPDDPVGYWREFSHRQGKIARWLSDKREIHVVGPGTDLRLSVAGRTFISCDGRHNLPDGEVFTGPVEDSVEGTVHFSYPAIYQSREVVGVTLEFKKGRVTSARADKNEEFLLKILDTDEGSRYVGEFAIGTNEGIRRFTKQILFDEKICRSFHLALGAGYPETGSNNRSSIHWDLICDLSDGEIRADGETVYRDGRFLFDPS